MEKLFIIAWKLSLLFCGSWFLMWLTYKIKERGEEKMNEIQKYQGGSVVSSSLDRRITERKPVDPNRGFIGRKLDIIRLNDQREQASIASETARYQAEEAESISQELIIRQTLDHRVQKAFFDIAHDVRIKNDEYERSGLNNQLLNKQIEEQTTRNKREKIGNKIEKERLKQAIIETQTMELDFEARKRAMKDM